MYTILTMFSNPFVYLQGKWRHNVNGPPRNLRLDGNLCGETVRSRTRIFDESPLRPGVPRLGAILPKQRGNSTTNSDPHLHGGIIPTRLWDVDIVFLAADGPYRPPVNPVRTTPALFEPWCSYFVLVFYARIRQPAPYFHRGGSHISKRAGKTTHHRGAPGRQSRRHHISARNGSHRAHHDERDSTRTPTKDGVSTEIGCSKSTFFCSNWQLFNELINQSINATYRRKLFY